MALDFRDAVRLSFYTKIALYLGKNGDRNMADYATIGTIMVNNTVPFIYPTSAPNTTYGIVPRENGEDLFYPGINILYLDEIDTSVPKRVTKKRFLLPVKILVTRTLDGQVNPSQVASEVRGVHQQIRLALSDKSLEIWDYTNPNSPVGPKGRAYYHEQGYRYRDESLAGPNGDIRHSLTLSLEYTNLGD